MSCCLAAAVSTAAARAATGVPAATAAAKATGSYLSPQTSISINLHSENSEVNSGVELKEAEE